MNIYRAGVLKQILKEMERDEYYIPRLKGDDTKAILLEKEDIELLIKKYEGKLQ